MQADTASHLVTQELLEVRQYRQSLQGLRHLQLRQGLHTVAAPTRAHKDARQ
jgi:hypothetical protein